MSALEVERTRTGWLTISAFVTDGDGGDVWLHTERYMGFTSAEARYLFREMLRETGWTLVE